MAIKKIQPSFGATLEGDFAKVIKTSIAYGLPTNSVNKALKYINTACPKRNDVVTMHFYNNCTKTVKPLDSCKASVTVVKGKNIYEKDIPLASVKPINLLYRYAVTVKKIVKGEIKPDKIEIKPDKFEINI